MKIKFNYLFLCISLFVFSPIARAQVIEMVSYTPDKVGNYDTLSAKSLANFSGSLEVNKDIVSFSDRLDFTSTNFIKANNATPSIHVYGDLYAPSIVISTATVSGLGKLYTNPATNSSITYASSDVIQGDNSVDLSNSKVVLQDNSKLFIDGVVMNNPNCTISWVTMPAYNIDSGIEVGTASNYNFAYCSSSSDTLQDWSYSVSRFTGLAYCSGNGWTDFNIPDSDTASSADGKCYRSYSSISPASCPDCNGVNLSFNGLTSSKFYCGNIQVYKCADRPVYENMYKKDSLLEYPNQKSTYIWDGVNLDLTDNADEIGFCANAKRNLKAQKLQYIDPNNNPYVNNSYPAITLPINSMTLSKELGEKSNMASTLASIYNRTGFSYCGFEADGAVNHNKQIYNKMVKNPTCTKENEINPYTTCWEQANMTYSGFMTTILGKGFGQICQEIKTNNTSLGDTFSCILNAPEPTAYKAYRKGVGIVQSVSAVGCDGKCLSSNGQVYCKNKYGSATSYSVGFYPGDTSTDTNGVVETRRYLRPLTKDGVLSGDTWINDPAYKTAATLGDSYDVLQTTSNGDTVYLNELFPAILLQCQRN